MLVLLNTKLQRIRIGRVLRGREERRQEEDLEGDQTGDPLIAS